MESTSLSISFIKTFFYRSIPALSAKSAFRPIKADGRASPQKDRTKLGGFWNFNLVNISVVSRGAGVSKHYGK